MALPPAIPIRPTLGSAGRAGCGVRPLQCTHVLPARDRGGQAATSLCPPVEGPTVRAGKRDQVGDAVSQGGGFAGAAQRRRCCYAFFIFIFLVDFFI